MRAREGSLRDPALGLGTRGFAGSGQSNWAGRRSHGTPFARLGGGAGMQE